MGFTLTELLAVVVIIGILFTLLIPAAFQIIERSQIPICAANIRTLGNAGINYFTERNWQYADGGDTGTKWAWWNSLGNYLDDRSITPRSFGNPLVHVRTVSLSCPKLASINKIKGGNYALNLQFQRKTHEIGKSPSLWELSGSEMAMFMCGGRGSASAPVESNPVTGANSDYITQNRLLLAFPHNANQYYVYPPTGMLHAVFRDGHVEFLSHQEIRNRHSKYWKGLRE